MKRILCTLLLLTGGLSLSAQEPSPFLHIDQFGYRPGAEKVAVLSNPQIGDNAALSFTPGTTLELRRASDGGLAWSGSPTVWNGGNTHPTSGDQGWWLDFSSFGTPGDYYIIDPDSGERSAIFSISENVYSSVMADAGKAFFYNRSSFVKAAPYAEPGWTDGMSFTNALQDTECSDVNDRENANRRRDLSGGWFDAGDNNKYTTFAHEAVNDLLWAYRENPGAFTDAWNIPESGNGIADVLDEVKWEMDWLRKMVNADGSAIIKMGNIEHSDNAQAPPSANNDRRYYGPTCTSASISAASMMSHAAIVFRDIPAWSTYATEITIQAEAAFAYWVAARNAGNLETECDDQTIKAGDADVNEQGQMETALAAAVHLYELTGDEVYNNYVRDNVGDAEYYTNNWWGPYKNTYTSAMVQYLSLPGAHSSTVTALRNSMTGIVRDDWNGFFGFNEDDLYRAFMPEWSYHWGSNSIAARYGVLNRVMARANLVANREQDLNRKADGMIYYLHGVNPMGMVYLSAMEGRGAERGIQEIYHFWFNEGTDWDNAETSLYGPAPGFLAGGPNKDFGRTNISPPANEPPMKSYKDWNTGWPEDSWEITEPAIYYQASYIRNLAALMAEEFALPVTFQSPLTARAQAKTVLLEWRVSAEIDASHYGVEYLNDRDEWESIGRVGATGANRYQFIHDSPREGNNEYRLRQEDLDGTFAYSDIANVIFTDRFANIKVFPNPVPSGMAINLSNLPAGVEIRLYDAAGRLLHRNFLRGSRTSITTNTLPAGIYSLELLQGREGSVWRQKVVVE